MTHPKEALFESGKSLPIIPTLNTLQEAKS